MPRKKAPMPKPLPIAPGRYKLAAPIKNANKDGRARYDWRELSEFRAGYYIVDTDEEFLYRAALSWYEEEKYGDYEKYEAHQKERAAELSAPRILREGAGSHQTWNQPREDEQWNDRKEVLAWNDLVKALVPVEELPKTLEEYFERNNITAPDAAAKILSVLYSQGKVTPQLLDRILGNSNSEEE